MDATVDRSMGRYAAITVNGLSSKVANGVANINVTAKSNGVGTPYVVPVKVSAPPTLKSVSLTQTNPTLTNAYERDYYGTLEAKVLDSAGNEMTIGEDYTIEYTVTKSPYGAENSVDPFGETEHDKKAEFEAWKLRKGNYNILATVKSTDDGSTKTATKTFKGEDVYSLDENDEVTVSSGKVDYKLEGSADITEGSDTTTGNIKVAAYNKNKKFVGYVNSDFTIADDQVWTPTDSTQILDAYITVQHNGKYIESEDDGSYNLYAASEEGSTNEIKNNISTTTGAKTQFELETEGFPTRNPWNYTKKLVIQGNTDFDLFVAKAGKATVKFNYAVGYKKNMPETPANYDYKPLNKTVEVKNGISFPTVTASETKVNGMSASSIVEVLETNVDMNSSDTLHDSLSGQLIGSVKIGKNPTAPDDPQTRSGKHWTITDTDDTGSSAVVNYVVVDEYNSNYLLACSLGVTFTES